MADLGCRRHWRQGAQLVIRISLEEDLQVPDLPFETLWFTWHALGRFGRFEALDRRFTFSAAVTLG